MSQVVPDKSAPSAGRKPDNPFWRNRTIDSYLNEATVKSPSKTALVAYRADRGDEPVVELTYSQLDARVARVAGSLRALGVGHGDIVAVQLPNWWEFVVFALAAGRVGAVVNPLMPIFREHELSFMLGLTEAKVFVVPRQFRGFDYETMAKGLRAGLPALKHVVVVDGEGDDSFDRLLMNGSGGSLPYGASEGLAPEELALIMFTSGTTGQPKGAMHCCNTLIALTYAFANRAGLDESAVIFGCSPLGHMTGYGAAMIQSVRMGAKLVLQDVWEPQRAISVMVREGVTYTMAATTFLSDIYEAVAAGAPRPQALQKFLCGGAPIPPVVIERAWRELGVPVVSLWGMTESLLGTVTEPARALEKSPSTDGCPVEGMEVRVADVDGKDLPVGQTGRLLVRGPQMFLGYYKRPDIPTVDAHGWLDTGDLAYLDEEGYIRINGRTKDIIIRGGENIPVVEIESLLFAHPAVADAAIVGFPDPRLGERSCAYVILKPGAKLSLADVHEWLAQHKTAKQYWPERLQLIEQMPRTLTGKIQKFVLRERAKKDVSA